MLLELFSRAYTLYSEMTIQQIEGYHQQAEKEVMNLLDEKSKGAFSKKSEDYLDKMIEKFDQLNPEEFSKQLKELSWPAIYELKEDPSKQKSMLEDLMGNSDNLLNNVKTV